MIILIIISYILSVYMCAADLVNKNKEIPEGTGVVVEIGVAHNISHWMPLPNPPAAQRPKSVAKNGKLVDV